MSLPSRCEWTDSTRSPSQEIRFDACASTPVSIGADQVAPPSWEIVTWLVRFVPPTWSMIHDRATIRPSGSPHSRGSDGA